MLYNNIDDGYPEAVIRALRKGLLKQSDYEQLIQCGNDEEFRIVLQDSTDYGKYIQQLDSGALNVNELRRVMYQKLRDEIEYIMVQASQPLYGFLERMLHMYQIDNVASFIAGVKGEQRPEVIAQSMNPLGEFQGLKSVQSFGSEDIVSLFSDILIDLPVGVYFRKYIDSMIEDINASNRDGMGGDNKRGVNVADITKCIEDESSENTKLYLKKIWITEFHRWIMANCNGAT